MALCNFGGLDFYRLTAPISCYLEHLLGTWTLWVPRHSQRPDIYGETMGKQPDGQLAEL